MGTRMKDKINLATLGNVLSFEMTYDKGSDSLLMQSDSTTPAISVDWDGELWVRINPSNGDIVGIEIENYKKYFLKKHSDYFDIRGLADIPVKSFVMELLLSSRIPFTKADFMRDLKKASQLVEKD